MSGSTSPNAPRNATDSEPPVGLKVGGVMPFSAADYPGKLAAVVFVAGCPWRCGYCHNPHLQQRPQQGEIAWSDVAGLLARRRGLIDAVVFSGGEPTMDPALTDAIHAARALGFGIGMHSAGIYPQRLAQLLPLVDWIGLDIKAPFSGYDKVTRIAASGEPALASLQAVLASGIDYEVRTTVHADLLHEEDLLVLASSLAKMGVRHYALQAFRKQGCANAALNATGAGARFSDDLVAYMRHTFTKFTLRCE